MVDRPYEPPIDWVTLPPAPNDWSELEAPAEVKPLLKPPIELSPAIEDFKFGGKA